MNVLKILYLTISVAVVIASITLTSTPTVNSESHVTTTILQETETTATETETITKDITLTNVPTPVVVDDSELELLAKIIYLEAGGCTHRHKQLVGCVVINRVNSSKFPNTIEDVVYQKNQYYPRGSKYLANAKPDSECYEIAKDLLTNGNHGVCPNNVLFQAEFVQGEIYEVIVSPYGSTTYFCYG